jgi:hypothetical protein
MDLYALMVVRANSYKTAVDRFKFDDIFWNFTVKTLVLKLESALIS